MRSIQTKPLLYAHYLSLLQEKAREMGYNLVLHGSLNRDCDLIAIPWVNEPQPHFDLIRALDRILTGELREEYSQPKYYNYSVLPGGRHSYIINMNRGGLRKDGFTEYEPDPQYYLDISVTPLATNQKPMKTTEQITNKLTSLEAQRRQAVDTLDTLMAEPNYAQDDMMENRANQNIAVIATQIDTLNWVLRNE